MHDDSDMIEVTVMREDGTVKRHFDQAAKADAGKPRLTLVPMQIVWDIAKIRDFGNKKYKDPDNWKTVEPERHFEAFLRHVAKAWDGDHMQIDPESGLLHLAHAACDLDFFLALMEERECAR